MFSNISEEIEKYNFGFSKRSKLDLKKDFGKIDSDGLFDSRLGSHGAILTSEKINLVLVSSALIVILLILLLRVINVQFIKRDEYLSLSRTNRLREILVQPERGVIFSNDGEIIARNRPAFGIQLNIQICSPDLKDLSECYEMLDKLKEFKDLNIDYEKVRNDIDQRKLLIIVATGLEKEKILPLEANINKLPGLIVVVQPIREYVYGESFAHVLGYIGLDEQDIKPVFVGKTGIERIYDDQLAGIPGTEVVQIDSSGKESKVIAHKDSLPGKNAKTYLNSSLQKKAYEVLKEQVENGKPDEVTGFKAEAGAIIAQDPMTGGVLALVNYPSYDPNKIITGVTNEEFKALTEEYNYPFYNRSVGAAYPPGSTFKMVPASAALMEGVVTPSTVIFDPGYVQVGSYIFRNWLPSGHGNVTLKRAIQISNDTYFYTIGGGHGDISGLGIEKLHDWAVKFGFGTKTGIDIDGEVSGYMPDGKTGEWYLGNTFITTIGQGDVLATPLQINNMVAYFANGGYLMKPKIVKSVDGVGEYEIEVLAQNMVSKDHYEIIRDGMKASVSPGGTGWPLFDFPIRYNGIELAGKTGTSEYIDKDGNERTHAWFTIFGPYDNPDIVLTVFLEGGGAGSDDAAPLAKEILDHWFKIN
jgi:penicillin-binding protein 2